jgi:hypothetical protein
MDIHNENDEVQARMETLQANSSHQPPTFKRDIMEVADKVAVPNANHRMKLSTLHYMYIA